MAMESKDQTNIRLTATAKQIMNDLTNVYGVAQGDVIEILLRCEAARLALPGYSKTLRDAGPPMRAKTEP